MLINRRRMVGQPAAPPPPGDVYGLDFPGVNGGTTIRFRYQNPHSNGLPIYGAAGAGLTYLFRVYPRAKPAGPEGYWTTFFWANDDGGNDLNTFLWVGPGSSADTYYGMHPYPDPPPNGRAAKWEISVQQGDYLGSTVVFDQWYTQAVRVWGASGATKHHEFYWDLPNTDAGHLVTQDIDLAYGNTNPPSPCLTFGDAPWNQGNEIFTGVIRGIQIYSVLLSLADIASELATPLSTVAGAAGIWYLNLNPTPTDITDYSGQGHHMSWVGAARPSLYTG